MTAARSSSRWSSSRTSSAPRWRRPLFFSVLTLRELWGNAQVFSETPVKISRADVQRVMQLTAEHVAEDALLRELFEQLGQGGGWQESASA